MAERVDSLGQYAQRFYSMLDGPTIKRVANAAGAEAKSGALDVVESHLGEDRAMSNFKKGKVKLSVGYDPGPRDGTVVLKHGPKGLWMLADKGRQRSGDIRPRKRGGKRALKTPQGARGGARFGPSRGLGTLRHTAAVERREAPKAGFKALQQEIRVKLSSRAIRTVRR